IFNEYISAKEEPFGGHPLGIYFRNDIPKHIYGTGLVDSKDYLVTGSVGQGNWAMVPWVCVFDRRITTSAKKGVYIVYLLEKNGKSLYLTLNQGCTELRSSHTKRETIQIMREKAAQIAETIDSHGFQVGGAINLGDGLSELGELYQKGTIFYKEYQKATIPDEAELRSDLAKMMEIYREYANKELSEESQKIKEESYTVEGEEKLTIKETIISIIDFVKRAELDPTHPYFLCLDEMNLARVEYYLSDFLSVIETRDLQSKHIVSEPLISYTYYGSDYSCRQIWYRFEEGKIHVYRDQKICAEYEINDFSRSPNAVFRNLQQALLEGAS
ncbi:MAG: DUF3578 domain-containing protein, partial [Selenomonadaceae bacterium]|nr:DUF3578 domain-containing protein [Selenomonadaceae bacterium]